MTWQDAYGALTTRYPDVPAEYLIGLERGKLGDWLQEVHDAGWELGIDAPNAQGMVAAVICQDGTVFIGTDDDTHRVDIMLVRAYLAWKGRAA